MAFPSTGVKLPVSCLLAIVAAVSGCGGGVVDLMDGDVDSDQDVQELSEYADVECGYPTFAFEIPDEEVFPEPLDSITLNACNHELKAIGGEVCGPYWYFWDWLPGGKPSHATEIMVILPDGSEVPDELFMGTWTRVCKPGFYFPVPGQYGIRVKLRNAVGMESGGPSDCPDCKEWVDWIDVRPSE